MQTGQKFEALVEIVNRLRQPDGCPWDIEQTHASLRQYLLEETYEVLECLDENNLVELPKELGDVLLQIVFHAQIASEAGNFTIDDVIDNLSKKLVERHPHVFGDATIKTADEQVKNWELLKKKEGKKSVIEGVPNRLPALQRAMRLQQKAATVGFDWPDVESVWKKFHEELHELQQALEGASQEKIEDEFGDVLFSLVNVGRFIKCQPENALRGTIDKFIKRFQYIEQEFAATGIEWHDASLKEMDKLWEEAKSKEL